MNNMRRKAIAGIQKQLAEMRDLMDEISININDLESEEEEYRDSLPENMHAGQRYDMAAEACESLDSAWRTLDDAAETINAVIDYLEVASERGRRT